MDVPPPLPAARPLGGSPVGGGGGGRARSGSPAVLGGSGGLEGPVELTITNLDSSRHPRDTEKLLLEMASRHTKVRRSRHQTPAPGAGGWSTHLIQ